MTSPTYNRATHFSIVWGITLSVLTLIEWYNLDRDPVRQEILSPFINRHIAVSLENPPAPETGLGSASAKHESEDAQLRYDVEMTFNGPLFLACFFGPIIVFHLLRILWNRVRSG